MEMNFWIIGAGEMATMRSEAIKQLNKDPELKAKNITVKISYVLSSTKESAKKLAEKHTNCTYGAWEDRDTIFDNTLEKPTAILVEVPHNVQVECLPWVLSKTNNILIGGPLAGDNTAFLKAVKEKQDKENKEEKSEALIIEGGFHALYDPFWQEIKKLIEQSATKIKFISCSAPIIPEAQWYFSEKESYGINQTHLCYVLNPLAEIFGFPTIQKVRGENINSKELKFDSQTIEGNFSNDIHLVLNVNYLANMPWSYHIVSDDFRICAAPNPNGGGSFTYTKNKETKEYKFEDSLRPFTEQLKTFVHAILEQNTKNLLNPLSYLIKSLQFAQTVDKMNISNAKTAKRDNINSLFTRSKSMSSLTTDDKPCTLTLINQ